MRRRLAVVLSIGLVIAVLGLAWLTKRHESEWKRIGEEARELSGQGKYAEALELAKKALEIAEQSSGPEHPNVATSLINLAALHQNQGQFAQAEPLLKRAVEIDRKSSGPNHPDSATSLNALGVLYNAQGKYALAEPLFKQALTIRQTALGNDHPLVAATLNNLGLVHIHQGQYAKAEPLLNQALKVQEAQENAQADTAATLSSLGMLHYSQGQYERAAQLYTRSLALREAALGPTHPDVALSLHSLGMLHYTQGNYAQAEPYDKRALAIYEKAYGANHPEVAKSLNNLAELYRIQGLHAQAEPLLKRALAISEKALGAEHPEVATTLNNLALLYRNQNQYQKAEPLLVRALSIDEKVSGAEHPNVAASLNNLALLYQMEGQYEKAQPFFERALAIRENALGAEHPDVARSLNNLAELHILKRDYAVAETLLKRSLAIFGKAHGADHPRLAASLNNLADVYARQARYPEALTEARHASQIYRQRIVFGGTGDTAIREAQQNRSGFAQHLSILAKLGQKGKKADLTEESFQLVQLEQATGTASAIAKMAARFAKGDDALAALVKKKQDAMASRAAQEARLVGAASKLPQERNAAEEKALHEKVAALDKEIADVDAELTQRFPEYQQLTRPEPVSIAKIQALLRSGEAMLVYSLGNPGKEAQPGYLWVIDRQRASFLPLDVEAEKVAGQVQTLRSQMEFDEDGQVPKVNLDTLHDLYRRLFAPALPQLSGIRHVMVVTDGALDSLPFSLLVASPPPKIRGPSDYRRVNWLVRRYALSVLPAVGSIQAFRQYLKPGQAQEPFAGFGDPLIGEAAVALPKDAARAMPMPGIADVEALRKADRLAETADELKAMATVLKADASAIWLRDKATEAQVKRMDLSKYRTIAFATHGVMAGQLKGMDEAGLILTPPAKGTAEDDGYLSAGEIARLKLNADWVVLSACNTAAADGTPGAEGLSGLAKAFFYAGSRSLLVSHWPVASEATVPLTTDMLSRYQARPAQGKAEAQRQAILALINAPDHPEYAHPAYWAPFVVVGEGGAGGTADSVTRIAERRTAPPASAPPSKPVPQAPPPVDAISRREALVAALGKREPGSPLEVEPQALAVLPDASFAVGYYLQFGAFVQRANADGLMARLKEKALAGKPPFIRVQGRLHLVRSGPWTTAAEARQAAQQLLDPDIATPIVVADSLPPGL